MRVCHHPKMGDMETTQKLGTTATRSQKTDEERDRKIERKGETLPNYYQKILDQNR